MKEKDTALQFGGGDDKKGTFQTRYQDRLKLYKQSK